MKSIYFVRHGQSEDNVAGIWSRPNTPLTSEGQNQARQAAAEISRQNLKLDLVFTSTYIRAIKTAQIIMEEIGLPPDLLKINAVFDERNWGELTGTPSHLFFNDKTIKNIDEAAGAEKLHDLQNRARKGLELMLSAPQKSILLVGHGTFARALRRVINGEPHTNEYLPTTTRLQNAEIIQLI